MLKTRRQRGEKRTKNKISTLCVNNLVYDTVRTCDTVAYFVLHRGFRRVTDPITKI